MKSLQQSILDAVLPRIVFEGWTEHALREAAQSIGLPAIDAERAFPGGVRDCIDFWSHETDRLMEETLKSEYVLEKMKIRERIATAVMVRLRLLEPHREAARRASAWLALPWNAPHATSLVYHTVDSMWYAAGDTSTDFNFYTKRGLLAKVYLSTLAVWLNDNSADKQPTQEFLYRRIENVMQIQKVKAKAKDFINKIYISARI